MLEGQGLSQLFMLILYLGLILALAYYVTRYISKRGLNAGRKKGTRFVKGSRLSVIDRIVIDREKSIVLMEYDNNSYLLGIGENVNLLEKTPISQEELERRKNEPEQKPADFATMFSTIKDGFMKKDGRDE